jgi:hypothetical protein
MQAGCESTYGDLDRCLLTCTRVGWPVTPTFTEQDTLTCRIYWARMASLATGSNRAIACIRASLNSARACGDPCEVYCRAGNAICTGGYFPDMVTCRGACQRAQSEYMNQVPEPANSFEVALLACRLRMLQTAVFDPAWCTYAAPNTCADSPCPGEIFPPP